MPALLLGLIACSGEHHDEVLVVMNANSPISVAIGHHYALRRSVPERNLVLLEIPLDDPLLGDDRHETISREDFETQIRLPLERSLTESGLVDRIEIIVTTKGIPLRVMGSEVEASVLLREATAASVDAELSLLFSDRIGSAGVVESGNPFFGDERRFREFRREHPEAPLHYLVARLTGYQDGIDPATGVPRDILRLLDAAEGMPASHPLWLVDLDPSLDPGMDAGNLVLLRPAAAITRSLGLRVQEEETPEFAGDARDIQAYASWGSNAGHEPAPRTYGRIGGKRYPGYFAPRAIAVDFVSTNARTFSHPPDYGQSLLADLVGLGVGGASGHVDEPTLPAVARPQILLYHYARGERAIEAYYRSIPYLGWMNVWVGDPLMHLDPAASVLQPTDLDADGVPDSSDNCWLIPNPRQRDSDGDGFGNFCDADVNGDGFVTTSWGRSFPRSQRGDIEWIALSARDADYNEDHDLDGDGQVNQRDVSLAQLQLFMRPGPGPRAHSPHSSAGE
ncbi:MAG: TIGR03790 family protein [Deltaproteobacteria bacterium]|nr:TIGR03790 family protein [Deltaproteobacteria bacterium]